MWRVSTLVALLWPSHLSGWFDGAPLDSLAEALLVGLIAPALIWLHPSFLRGTSVRAVVAAILLIKLTAAVAVQQDGWCVTFDPPRPMVRDSTGKPLRVGRSRRLAGRRSRRGLETRDDLVRSDRRDAEQRHDGRDRSGPRPGRSRRYTIGV